MRRSLRSLLVKFGFFADDQRASLSRLAQKGIDEFVLRDLESSLDAFRTYVPEDRMHRFELELICLRMSANHIAAFVALLDQQELRDRFCQALMDAFRLRLLERRHANETELTTVAERLMLYAKRGVAFREGSEESAGRGIIEVFESSFGRSDEWFLLNNLLIQEYLLLRAHATTAYKQIFIPGRHFAN